MAQYFNSAQYIQGSANTAVVAPLGNKGSMQAIPVSHWAHLDSSTWQHKKLQLASTRQEMLAKFRTVNNIVY
jgi:hypothetical protein